MRHVLCLAVCGVLMVSGLTGCASGRTTTTKTEERVQRSGTSAPQSSAGVLVGSETTTVTKTEQEPRGILSTAVHVVGEIIALPFRLVGGLLRAIF